MSIRSKLFAVIDGMAIQKLGDEALLDVVIAKMKAQEKEIEELCKENEVERQRLRNEIEATQHEQKSIRNDPHYGAVGQYFFEGKNGDILDIQVKNYSGIEVTQNIKTKRDNWIGYQLRRISGYEYDAIRGVRS